MSERWISIAAEIFRLFPGYVRGVVIARGVANGPSPPELVDELRAAEASLRAGLDLEHLAAHPRIRSWREAYRSIGVKPAEYRSSIEALARRVLRDQSLPSISALVDAGSIVSLRHLVPVGGHALDVSSGDLTLRVATGREEFVPLGSDPMEHPFPGEIVFAEGDAVLTRRWTWRQGAHTLTALETTAIEFNVDGLPPVEPAEVEEACGRIASLVARFCGGEARIGLLTEAQPRLRLD
jgi:DNA/RNA-binding domain of Phe-tRNA-synthetase-like protein